MSYDIYYCNENGKQSKFKLGFGSTKEAELFLRDKGGFIKPTGSKFVIKPQQAPDGWKIK